MRALVIDDDAVRRRAVVDELGRHGHEVQALEDVRAALAAAGTAPAPGLITVGATVGGGDGRDVAAAIRSGPAGEAPIVVLVGAPGDVDVIDALRRGATDVWTLPPADVPLRLRLAEQHARLRGEHLRLGGELALLRSALDQTGTGFVLTDPRLDDNPIVYANASFLELTGYGAEEVLGRNCRFLQAGAADRRTVARLRDAIAACEPVTVEIRNRRKDGRAFWNEVHVSPLRDDRGEVVRFVGVQIDVSAYRDRERLFALEQRARESAERAERRSAFLAAASPQLDATLDLRTTLDALARISVPYLADLCVVDEVEGDTITRVAAAAADPGLERLLQEVPAASSLAALGTGPLAQALRTGGGVRVDGQDAARVLPGLADGTLRAAMVLPLRARGRSVGALVLGATDARRRFGEEELGLAEDLGRRAALALDNARLFAFQRHVAETLQASLLPEALPEVDGLELAARYRPAGEGVDIGGDFYDVFPGLGGLVLTIGDVTGKGAGAASLTALTRHTLRTAAAYEHSPAGVLLALNRALLEQRSARGKYCTVAVCALRGTADGFDVELASAGHPLPFVLRADGSVEELGSHGTLLGFIDDPALADVHGRLRRGDALVLYTDGLTEVPTRGGVAGPEPLRSALESCAGLGAGAIAARAERATDALQDGPPRDDVAVAVALVR